MARHGLMLTFRIFSESAEYFFETSNNHSTINLSYTINSNTYIIIYSKHLSSVYRKAAMKAFTVQYAAQGLQLRQTSMTRIVFEPMESQANINS